MRASQRRFGGQELSGRAFGGSGITTPSTIIIPVRNEADCISSVIHTLFEALERNAMNTQVIVVNDGSLDQTARLVESLRSMYASLTCISLEKQMGKSVAIATGVAGADTDVIATMDGDGQVDPNDTVNLINVFVSNNCDLVIGTRRRRCENLPRRLASWAANDALRRLFGVDVRDSGSGQAVFDRDRYFALPALTNLHRYMAVVSTRLGKEVVYEPMDWYPRRGGTSKYTVARRTVTFVKDLIEISRADRLATVGDKFVPVVASLGTTDFPPTRREQTMLSEDLDSV